MHLGSAIEYMTNPLRTAVLFFLLFSAHCFASSPDSLFTADSLAWRIDTLTSRYPTGDLESVILQLDGERNGIAKFYYPGGVIKSEIEYRRGKVSGSVKHYYDNGKVKEIYFIKEGKRDGNALYYDSLGTQIGFRQFEQGFLLPDETPKSQSVVKTEVSTQSQLPANTPTKKEEFKLPVLSEQEKQKLRAETDFFISREEENRIDPAFYISVDAEAIPKEGWDELINRIKETGSSILSGKTGTIVINAYVNYFGNVIATEIATGIEVQVNSLVEMAVYSTRFLPAIINKRPANSQVKLTFTLPL